MNLSKQSTALVLTTKHAITDRKHETQTKTSQETQKCQQQYKQTSPTVKNGSKYKKLNLNKLEMWDNTQRDGRPAEYT